MAHDFDALVDRGGTWATRWEKYAGRDVVPLWVADMDFRAPPAVREALAARLAHGVFGYTAEPPELRAAIVERLARRYRWHVEPDWIVFLPGVVPGLHMAARSLAGADEHVILPVPVYQHFKRAVQLAPREFTEAPLALQGGRWVFDLDFLRKSISPKTRLFLLCNPQNPGGTVFTRAELTRLAELAQGCVLVSDEIHCDLVLEKGREHVPVASLAPEISRRTVTLMAASKTYNVPGAACAWAIIEDPELRRRFSADLNATVPHAALFGYVAALAAYRDDDGWLRALLEYLRGNRDLVESSVGKMRGLALAHVEATFLAWIDARGLGVADPHALFLEHGVALSPGAQFGAPGFVRLNFGTQRARLKAALERMASACSRAG